MLLDWRDKSSFGGGPNGEGVLFLTSACLTNESFGLGFLSSSVFVTAFSWGGALGAARVVVVAPEALVARGKELLGSYPLLSK